MKVRTLLLVAVVVAVIGALVFGSGRLAASGFEWKTFASTLAGIQPGWTAASIAMMLLTYAGRAWRWQVMMVPVREDASLARLVSATLVGFTAVVFFGRPGEFVRPWLISIREQVPFSSQLAIWFLERIFDLLSVILLFGFALTRSGSGTAVSPRLQGILQAGGYVALAAAIACIVVLVVSVRFALPARGVCDRVARVLPLAAGNFLRRSFDSFLTGMEATGNARSLLRISVLTALEWALIVGGIYCIFRAFPPTVGFGWTETLVFTGFVAFGSAVQLPGIGGGMQVAAVVVLTELFLLPVEAASACAVLVWAISWLTVVPFGLFLAFREGLQWHTLRHIDEKAEAATAKS